jgi:hypothetical protein
MSMSFTLDDVLFFREQGFKSVHTRANARENDIPTKMVNGLVEIWDAGPPQCPSDPRYLLQVESISNRRPASNREEVIAAHYALLDDLEIIDQTAVKLAGDILRLLKAKRIRCKAHSPESGVYEFYAHMDHPVMLFKLRGSLVSDGTVRLYLVGFGGKAFITGVNHHVENIEDVKRVFKEWSNCKGKGTAEYTTITETLDGPEFHIQDMLDRGVVEIERREFTTYITSDDETASKLLKLTDKPSQPYSVFIFKFLSNWENIQ